VRTTTLRQDLDRAGYYPQLVADIIEVSLGGESPVAHLVHAETTFDSEEVRRHITVLVLTASRLLVTHVDDHPAEPGQTSSASATTEAVPVGSVTSVSLTHVVAAPVDYQAGDAPTELTLVVGWGAVSRVDIEPVICPDPACEADHGMTGTIAADDVVIRVSSAAEGAAAVTAAKDFARQLSTATAR